MFKKGDRVRYSKRHPKNGRVEYDGREGVVTCDSNFLAELRDSHTGVEWDKGTPWTPHNPFTLNLELIDMKTIDTTKPLLIVGHTGGLSTVFVTETSDGGILVTSPSFAGWVIFDKQGQFVRSDNGSGKHFVLKNKVETETIHIRLSGISSPPETSVSRKVPAGNAVAAIEVTLTDGIVTGVSLARANREPIRTDRVS